MTFSNNTKILLTTLLCNFDNFLVNHYFDLNCSLDCKNECNNFTNYNVRPFDSILNYTTNKNYFNYFDYLNYSNYSYYSYYYYYYDYLNNIDYTSIINYKENFYNNYPNYYNLFFCAITIIFSDFLLMFLFGSKARWFQLHAFTNLLIVNNIIPGLKNIIIYNIYSNNIIENIISNFYIIVLHLYHILSFKNLYFIDYFHHIFFVGLGVFPSVLFLKTNQSFLAYITGMGIPGIIEYGSLTLYKNNYIKLLTQKKLISLTYNYFRYPLCVFGLTLNYINYKNGYLIDNYYLTIYLNFLLYLNGSLFNYLTLNSYFKYKYEIKTAIDINYSKKNK